MFHLYFLFIATLTIPFSAGAEPPNPNINLVFYPTENDQPVSGGVAFNRSYTLNGPAGGGPLLPGMRLHPGPRFSYAAQPSGVYQYNPQTGALQVMNTAQLTPPLNGPMAIAYDSTLERMVLVAQSGLYNYIVPDPANAPASGIWTFLSTIDTNQVDSITYHEADDMFYAVSFSYGGTMPPMIQRIRPDGLLLAAIPLPTLPFDINATDYESELISIGNHLVLFLEPRDSSTNPIQESRIYLIDPVTLSVQLTYQELIQNDPSDITPPTIQLLAPANGNQFPIGAPILLSAHADDADGSIQRVEFLRDGTFLAQGNPVSGQTDLYNFSWSGAPLGAHTLAARAIDTAGNIATSAPVIITLTNVPSNQPPDTTAPVVQLRSPAHGTNIALGVSVLLSAHAEDAAGPLQQLEFLRNGTALAHGNPVAGQPNLYNFTWSGAPLGTHILAARARDLAGNMATSAPVTITVTNPPPTADTTPPLVELRAPRNGTNIDFGVPIVLTALANDVGGTIQRLEFLRDGTVLARGVSTGERNTYTFTWNNAASGTHTLAARAFDAAGNVATSPPISIVVLNNPAPTPTNLPPIVRLTEPAANSTFPLGPIRITAAASDPDGRIAKIEFFVNNDSIRSLTPTNETNIFSIEWLPRSRGAYTLTARATDDDGRRTTSTGVRVTIVEAGNTDLISARRSLPEEFRSGKPFEVEIDVRASRDVSWTVEDQVPAGWRVIGISHGGRFNPETRKVTFGPFQNRTSRTLQYHAISSPTNIGLFTFSGIVTANGQSEPITGELQTRAKSSHKKVKIEKDKHGKVIIRIDRDDDDDDDDHDNRPRWIVEFTESLKDRDWRILPNAKITISETGEISIDDPNSTSTSTRRFYRLRIIDED
jgi:hypothetical protein